MKAILIVDIPVDESCELDEYSMVADLDIYPETPTIRGELSFKLNHVAIRPLPLRRMHEQIIYAEDKEYLRTNVFTEYDEGFNACLDEILGEEE